jgi:hypothetical protein
MTDIIIGQVERGIRPSIQSTTIPQRNYPFKEMRIGDSFSVKLRANGNSLTSNETAVLRQRVYSAAHYYNQRRNPGASFQIKNQDNGLRVWRTA